MKNLPPHIKVVLFDHDDTLFGTIEAKWAQHKFVAKTHYNQELRDEKLKEHWGKPLDALVCALYDTDNAEEALNFNKLHHHKYPKHPFSETISTLKKLKELGKLVGIITATSRFSFENDLTLHKIPLALLDFTQTYEDTPYHKPDPRVFEPAITWLNKQGILPKEVLYIGDGLHDMKAALGAGFSFIGVETGLVTREQFEEHGTISLASLGDLVAS